MAGVNLHEGIMEVAFEPRIEKGNLSRLRRIPSVIGETISEAVIQVFPY